MSPASSVRAGIDHGGGAVHSAGYHKALSSEVATGCREENASKQKTAASALIRSEPMLQN